MSTPGPSTPPPERSLDRQLVLDEDEYTAALSHIIARDFFPSLVHLDATNTYLDALHTQDPALISASVRRLEELSTPAPRARPWQTPSETPYGAGPADTPLPLHTPRTDADGPPAKRARYDTGMSLDAFQARYTSEDNSSFTQILEEENKRRKEKYGWAWDAQRRVEAQRERMLEGRERMLIEAPPATGVREKMRIEVPVPKGLITAAGEDKGKGKEKVDGEQEMDVDEGEEGEGKELALRATEGGEEVVDVMAPKKDTRSAGVDGWRFRTRNAFMFPPDADVSPHDPLAVARRANADAKNEPKAIKHSSTRLAEQKEDASGSRGVSAPPEPYAKPD
ncbi:hypothetical protein EVG20_g7619 [Dentipellis fragilis]|uniref:Nuclear protein DGCR14 n=1 Tax=Dentipellis fragilis TaxID=205917 RepID=A0A4Y9YBF7_9AGAM|nr:hypothetical protein EVG20_g7619 [Dentipellis fragilis]